MTYYRVIPKYDQNRRKDGSILIKEELYTEKELKRFQIPSGKCEKIELPKSKVYFSFGARFMH